MQIFTNEIKSLVISNLVCSWLGHKESEWMQEWWAPAHSTGYKVKVCNRCKKRLQRVKAQDKANNH